MRHKVDAHIRVIDNICSTLPISRIIVEIAQFDTQKIKNPDISGNEYQEGDQLGFWNVREYVLARDGHKCQHCKGKSKDPILNVHHIESRKTGGDSPSNLITLCETCHKEYHSKNLNALRLEYHYKVRLVRRHNRQIHKQKVLKGGAKKPNQSPFEVFGFRLFDRVMFEGNYYFIFGRRKSGSLNIRDINGGNQRNVTYKKLRLSIGKRFMIQKEMN